MRPSPHGVPCARCGMLESPEWRRGEAGIRDLCNACGLKYYREKKQREKVARKAATSSSSAPVADAYGPGSWDEHHRD
ncbi:hypothetical protein BCR44DRAFT_1391468 [Catenaria anguillulae PL171]|uniref:GATA-type domain-containing protein n=1 Tax=Catenaria anguillulae PL171 TaxID=765915 RepID=A0A1Y2HES0_9FUNG|nr:hypothetical protein BCR44DRAFT_1391468 [Catenaria anguillulae PL171]